MLKFSFSKKALLTFAAAAFIFIAVAFGSLYKIEARINADEWIWVPIGVKFVNALEDGQFSKTKFSTRPGVSITWVSGLTTSLGTKFGSVQVKTTDQGSVFIDETGYKLNRIVFGVISALLVTLIFLLMTHLLSFKAAFAAGVLIATNPLVLFKGTLVWTDLWVALFMLASLQTYLIYWKNGSKNFLFFSGIFLGLAIATKTIGIMLLPTFFLAPLLLKRANFSQAFKASIVVGVLAFLTLFLLFPYLWQNPLKYFARYQELALEISQTDPSSGASLLFYPNTLLKTEPIVFVFSLLYLAFSISPFNRVRKRTLEATLLVLASLTYLAILVFVSQATYLWGKPIASIRYSVPLVLFLIFLFVFFTERFASKRWSYLWIIPALALLNNLYTFWLLLPCETGSC